MDILKEAIYHLANIDTAIRDGYLKHLFQRTFRIAQWKEFLWVVRHWRLYYDTISAMHNEWFSIDVNAPVQYMVDGDSLYCKHCGCKYVQWYRLSEQMVCRDEESHIQWHLPGCLHYDIDKLRSCWR